MLTIRSKGLVIHPLKVAFGSSVGRVGTPAKIIAAAQLAEPLTSCICKCRPVLPVSCFQFIKYTCNLEP